MPIKVRVRNCQSIKDASITIEGLTVLTGANNSGKTAFMRAIRAPFINAPVGALVRYGEKSLIVDVEFDDGQSFRFEKGPTVKPAYSFNGDEPLHPGREVPQELEALGVVPVVVGKDKLWPQVATQFPSGQFSGPIFLLDRPGSIMAEVVADVERVGRLSQAMKLSKSDAKKAKDKLGVRRADHKDITEELAGFDGLDEAVSQVAAVEAQLDEAGTLATEIVALTALETRHTARTQEVAGLAGIEAVEVPGVDAIEDARGVGVEIDALTGLGDRWSEAQDEVSRLAGIEDVDLGSDLMLAEAPVVGAELAALGALEDRWSAAIRMNETWSEAQAVAEGLPLGEDDPQIAKVQKGLAVLADLQDRWSKAQAEVERLAGDLAGAESAETAATEAVVVVMGDAEQCPTCHTPMTDTHLHGEVT